MGVGAIMKKDALDYEDAEIIDSRDNQATRSGQPLSPCVGMEGVVLARNPARPGLFR